MFRLSSSPSWLAAAAALALLSACEDPSNVGLSLIGDRGGEPVVRILEPSEIGHFSPREVSGNNERTLLGMVQDPLLGTVRANAYFDFNSPSSATSFREGTADYAALELLPNYVFGDTTGTISIDLYDIADEWSAQGGTVDTTFTRGEYIASYSFAASDSLITLELPDDWVARNDTTLRSTHFASVFHGLLLEARSGNSVLGLASASTRLRAAAGADTVLFTRAMNLTSIERDQEPTLPEDRLLIASTAGPAVEMSFDFSETGEDFALNRARLTVTEDSLLSASEHPPHYVRERAQTLHLFARTPSNRLFIQSASRNQDGQFIFRSSEFQVLMDQFLRGRQDIEGFELRVPASPASLNHVFIHSHGDQGPTLSLTLTPLLD